eukprot:362520-Chlamydomonas_euryale.AAC.1
MAGLHAKARNPNGGSSRQTTESKWRVSTQRPPAAKTLPCRRQQLSAVAAGCCMGSQGARASAWTHGRMGGCVH